MEREKDLLCQELNFISQYLTFKTKRMFDLIWHFKAFLKSHWKNAKMRTKLIRFAKIGILTSINNTFVRWSTVKMTGESLQNNYIDIYIQLFMDIILIG